LLESRETTTATVGSGERAVASGVAPVRSGAGTVDTAVVESGERIVDTAMGKSGGRRVACDVTTAKSGRTFESTAAGRTFESTAESGRTFESTVESGSATVESDA
jgi:hypothetical protein